MLSGTPLRGVTSLGRDVGMWSGGGALQRGWRGERSKHRKRKNSARPAVCHAEKKLWRELWREKQADKLEWGLVRAAPSPQFPRPLSLQMLHIKQDFTVKKKCLPLGLSGSRSPHGVLTAADSEELPREETGCTASWGGCCVSQHMAGENGQESRTLWEWQGALTARSAGLAMFRP